MGYLIWECPRRFYHVPLPEGSRTLVDVYWNMLECLMGMTKHGTF